MDHIAFFGEVRDSNRPHKIRKKRPPKTEIGKFYEDKGNEVPVHWCKLCRRWHGDSCFYGATK